MFVIFWLEISKFLKVTYKIYNSFLNLKKTHDQCFCDWKMLSNHVKSMHILFNTIWPILCYHICLSRPFKKHNQTPFISFWHCDILFCHVNMFYHGKNHKFLMYIFLIIKPSLTHHLIKQTLYFVSNHLKWQMWLLLVRVYSSKFCYVCPHSQTHPLIAYLTKFTSIGLDVLRFFPWGTSIIC
jgi:hypothetical protein